MTTIWITYAWEDNKEADVDFIAQELGRTGLVVKLDKWNIGAGKRLWEQIENFIINPIESDAWIFYATQNSLGSEACKEEYSYALDRGLHSRGTTFPIIGLFPSSVDTDLIPAGLRTRLFVSITDTNWKERIKAAAEGRNPAITKNQIEPYFIQIYSPGAEGMPHTIEVRPRAGSWSPFFAAIPITEKDNVNPSIMHGPKNRPIASGMLFSTGNGPSTDGQVWVMFAQNEATPTQSYYINCQNLPSKLYFGIYGGHPFYVIEFGK